MTFVKNELKKYQKVLRSQHPEYRESPRKEEEEEEEVLDAGDEEHRRRSSEALLEITQYFLRRMEQEEVAECLQRSKKCLKMSDHLPPVKSVYSSNLPP